VGRWPGGRQAGLGVAWPGLAHGCR